MVSKKEARWARKSGHGLKSSETCLECPATLKFWAPWPNLEALAGSYMKTTLRSRKFNGGRPIYINRDSDMKNAPVYLFFVQENLAWSIGLDYRVNMVYGFAAMEAQCPRDANYWYWYNGTGFERHKVNMRAGRNWKHPPKDTQHIVWNIHRRRWEREKVVWDHGELATTNGTTASGEEDDNNATENESEEVEAENGTNDTVEEDDANATEDKDTDAVENETAESGEEDERNESRVPGPVSEEHTTE